MNMILKVGPYDALYASSPENMLWPDTPSHLIEKLTQHFSQGVVLDAGCGDGANALFLEQSGFSVHGIDISRHALTGLRNRFAKNNLPLKGRYELADAHDWHANQQKYTALMSCGLFHCLDRHRRQSVHAHLNQSLISGGLVLFSCLTNVIPLPNNHLTSGLELVDLSEVHELFSGMSVEYFKEGVIQDRHGDLVDSHEHSVVWVMARNIN